MRPTSTGFAHPGFTRRVALQASAVGLLGFGSAELAALRAASNAPKTRVRSCIFIFLSGGLAQHESFDLKPDAPDDVRGEFRPIDTKTPGIRICEHLPLLAQRSQLWSLVRSLTHSSNDHSAGHHIMLTGRSDLPTGFNPNQPRPQDWPSIAALAGRLTQPRNNLPPAVVLPEKLVHNSGRVIPGQFASALGGQYDPWFVEASAFEPLAYGAFPQYEFDHQQRQYKPRRQGFITPNLSLPDDLHEPRLARRLDLLQHVDRQTARWQSLAERGGLDDHRAGALSLLAQPRVRRAFDVRRGDPRQLDRYGDNAFGWSLLMARQLVEAGVNLVQVNLGNNETWDTHGNAFPHLRDKLFPPTDRALSALLDDLGDSGLLDDVLVVMAGEFGRTPRISLLPQHYKLPGRDHWGAVQSVFLAGGGVQGGRVVGSSDKRGAYPNTEPQTPENLAATIYHALGIPATAAWHDAAERPHFVYHDVPMRGLT